MAKSVQRIKSIDLRRTGESIIAIAHKLGVSKSSVSHWCKNIELTAEQRKKLLLSSIKAGHKGRLIGAQMNRERKEGRIRFHEENGHTQINKLTSREFLIAGTALYWAEGSKTDRSQLSLVNSDPVLILFMYHWFQTIFSIRKEDFLPRISINEIHRPRVKKVLTYWSRLLKLPRSQFGNISFIKAKQKKIYANYDLYYGVLSLRIRKSTDLKYRIKGLIKALGSASG
ncbi:MAG: hypothetical protein AAB590_02540 [Patescibacteria group bacterium]